MSRRTLLRRLGVIGFATGVKVVLPGAGPSGQPEVLAAVERLRGTATRSVPVRTSIPFSLVGFDLFDDEAVEFRTSLDGESWTSWVAARRIAADGEGPDRGSIEDGAPWRTMTHPVWVGEARWLQVRGVDPGRVRASLIDSVGLSRSGLSRVLTGTFAALAGTPAVAHAAAFRPGVISRAAWGADESWRAGSPRYADDGRLAVIHHTATGNDYTAEDVPAILRGIYRYHTQTLGWDDIGYNFVVDRFGRVFEGRAGGTDRLVIGAHAAGHNAGSIGVAALGCYDSEACVEAAVGESVIAGLDSLVAWKFAYHRIDPYGSTDGGPTIVGHRDVGSTTCPGDLLHAHVRGDDPMSERVGARVFGFRDVPRDSTFAADIAWIAAAGITRGCNPPANDLFCPTDVVTRQQMAAFLARALG